MARSLGYTPPPLPEDQARLELDDFLNALRGSGLLRAATGAVRTYPQLLGRVLDTIDADTVRSLLALTSALRGPDAEGSARLAAGIRQARSDAAAALTGPPPGPRLLLRRLRDPDTRRGLAAALAALTAIGGALGSETAAETERDQGEAATRY